MSRVIHPLTLLFIGAALMLSAGCGPTRLVVPAEPRPAVPASPVPAAPSSAFTQADDAWRVGDMAASERLYSALRIDPGLTAEQYDVVFSRLNAAALANGHDEMALDALRSWSIARPDATQDERWIHAWGATLARLPADVALSTARTVTEDVMSPDTLKAEAYGVLLVRGPKEEASFVADNLGGLYVASDQPRKAVMERGLLKLAAELSADGLVDILQLATPEADMSFPWSVLLLEKARREMASAGGGTDVPARSRISAPGVFADIELMARTLQRAPRQAEVFTPVESTVPLHPSTTALALPLSGPYAALGRKIAAGAEAARAELNRTGIATEVIVIDTDRPEWTEEVSRLPAECVMVGGPIMQPAYAEAKRAGLTKSRVFFTFLASLDAGEEGRVAWRFFTSPRDQVGAVMRYASEAGVRTFASLYPDEAYGKRMNALFLEAAPGDGGSAVARSVAYAPGDVSSWNEVVGRMVDVRMVGKVPTSAADFEAIYLPDAWDKASLLIPYLFFNGEDRLLILGSSLWDMGLAGGPSIDASNLCTAVYPTAWNAVEPTPASKNLAALLDGGKADFWSGLGYDFVRFASAMHGGPFTSATEVNGRLATASRINWTMAPLSWTPSGIASQSLFILNPTAKGAAHVKPSVMAGRLADVRERYCRRVEAAEEKAVMDRFRENAARAAERRKEEALAAETAGGDAGAAAPAKEAGRP